MRYLLILCIGLLWSCQSKTPMKTTIQLHNESLQCDLSQPIDISLAIQHQDGVGAWYINQPEITHVEVDGYVGKVELGGSTNFNNVHFNPHSHGTHTECIGHITEQFHSVNDALKTTFFKAQLFTITPEQQGDDLVITAAMFNDLQDEVTAVIIRTLPNAVDKKEKNYSNTNPPYLQEAAALRFRESGIHHILIDLPSVDKEKDNGALLAHKAFWNYDGEQRLDATITELIYVPDAVKDGMYLLDLQVAPIENDAAPSRPVLYKLL